MVWQQWVLLFWMLLRVPFMITREVKRARPDVPVDKYERAVVISILAVIFVQAGFIALVVTI